MNTLIIAFILIAWLIGFFYLHSDGVAAAAMGIPFGRLRPDLRFFLMLEERQL